MQGTYDQTFSLMHSKSEAFHEAQARILKLVKYRIRVNKLNLTYLYKTNDFTRKESLAIRKALCPKCPEDREECENDRDNRRRYHCKTLSKATGENVRLYFPSQNDLGVRKEQIKRGLMQTVARTPGITQNQLLNSVRGDHRLIRDNLKELTARGLLRCSDRMEQNRRVKRYNIVFD